MQLQLYTQLQPDWHDIADDSGNSSADNQCWLDVYERNVHLNDNDDTSVTDDAEQHERSDRLDVHIEAPASTHFALDLSAPMQVPVSPSPSPSRQEHLVEIVAREREWIEVHAHYKQHIVRSVFQSPTAYVNSTDTDAHSRDTPRRPQLYAVDISRDEQFIAVGGADGHCALYNAHDRTEAFVLRGHVSDVTTTQFFPSSVVLLSGSLDFTLRIWSATTGQCAAILQGHRGGVEDTAILGRGRNVLSCSTDGLIHLWSCGTQDVIAKWTSDTQSAVHCLSVLDDTATHTLVPRVDEEALPAPQEHEDVASTAGNVLFAGLASGATLGVDIRMRDLVLNLRGTAPILSCAASSSMNNAPTLLTGSDDGVLTTWDLRSPRSPLALQSRSAAPIHRIVVVAATTATATATPRVWTAHGDGVCCLWGTNDDDVVLQLTGPVYDPLRAVAVARRSNRVVTVGRDGLVRDYTPHIAAWATTSEA